MIGGLTRECRKEIDSLVRDDSIISLRAMLLLASVYYNLVLNICGIVGFSYV